MNCQVSEFSDSSHLCCESSPLFTAIQSWCDGKTEGLESEMKWTADMWFGVIYFSFFGFPVSFCTEIIFFS